MANKNQQVTLLSDASVGNILQGIRDPFSSQIKSARLQGLINFQKESALATQMIAKDYRLQQSTETSIANAFMNIAFVGLSLNPIKQHCALLPRWNDKIRQYEASLSIMYRGLMWLAGQAGVKDISVDVVYSADRFKLIKSDEGDKFEHEFAHSVPRDDPHDQNSGLLVSNKYQGTYVAARMPGSPTRKVEWVPAEYIYVVRGKSESYIDRETGKPHPKSPWTWSFDEMTKKVGIKIAQKRWEESVIENEEWRRFQTAVALDNVNEGVIPARADDIPGTAEHVASGKDKAADPPKLLDMKQLAEIEKLVEQVAPNRDDAPNNVSAYMSKIARTFRQNTLAAVEASKFNEITNRIEDAIQKAKDKKAADPKAGASATVGTGKQKGQGQSVAGKQQDAAAKGANKPAADKQTKAGQGPQGGEAAGGNNRPADREPGSDDDGPGEDHSSFSEDPNQS